MIQKMISDAEEIKQLSTLWLEASLDAHSFIDAAFWQKNQILIETEYLPNSLTYVYFSGRTIKGFLSLVEVGKIGGLFVGPAYQRQGIGTELMQVAKRLFPILELDVYAENERAVKFYVKEGFKEIETCFGDDTGAKQIKMRWQGNV